MRAFALVLLLAVGACAYRTTPAVQPAPDTRLRVYEEDCLTPPDSEGACVLRNQGIVLF